MPEQASEGPRLTSLDVTISLVRLTIRCRRQLIDGLRDKRSKAFDAIADAFEEDVAVLEQARDALVEARAKGTAP